MELEDISIQPKKRAKERVQLDFSPDALQCLDNLKEQIHATTRAETVRQALRLFEWFVNEVEPDSTIEVTNKEGTIVAKFKAMLLHNATRPGS